MSEKEPKVFYCQNKDCKIAYIILIDAKVRVVPIERDD